MPQNPSFLEQMSEVFDPSLTSAGATSSSSCPALGADTPPKRQLGGRQRQDVPPPFLTEDEQRMWAKERQKKDNHNQSMFNSLLISYMYSRLIG